MFNLELVSYENSVNYKIKLAYLITKNYSKKIKSNEVHSPLAAKLILVDENEKMKKLFLLFPIIYSNELGNIIIWTDIKLENVLDNSWIKKMNLRDLKHKIKILTKKEMIGLTINEIIKKNELESKLELFLLDKQKDTSKKG